MKKGQSEIIITVLLILLVIIMLVIIWNIVVPIIQKSRVAEDIGSMTARLEIQKAQTNLIANSSGCVFVTLKRAIGAGNVSGAKLIFFSDSGQEAKDVSGRLNEQEWKKFDVCLTNPNVTGLRVYPLLISDEGESVTGKIYDEVGKVAGSASVEPSCTPQCSGKVCGNDGCGGSCGTCGSGQCVEGVCSLVKEISGCSILNESGTTYMLNQSISDMLYFSNCIRIVADNITLDCNLKIINTTLASTSNYALFSNASFSIIKNCYFFGRQNIQLSGANYVKIISNNFSSSGESNVRMINSKFTNLSNNLFYGGLYAIYSTYSNNSFIEKNKFLSSSSSAILTNYAHNVLVNDNYFVNDSYAAIAIDGANNSFQNLFINQSNRGIRVSYERNDLIYNVTIFNCTSGASLKEGISLQRSGNVRVINNSINLANTGIIVDSGGNHTISGNIIQNLISGYGINLGYSKNTSIYNNRVTNTSVGIYVSDNLNGSIYNNYFNNSVNFQFYNYAGYLYNDWNTTLRTGTNIAGGSQICGNVYVTPSGSGISQTCTDSVAPLGICDSGYSLQIYNYDSCPLKI